MVKLDRVEMLRNEDSEERGETTVALAKQQQTKAVRDKITAFHGDVKEEEECREEGITSPTTPEESREGTRQEADEEEVFIEAEFETVLETDFKLSALEDEQSQSMRDTMVDMSVRSERILAPMDDEVSQYGVEVEYKSKISRNVFTGFTEEDLTNVEEESESKEYDAADEEKAPSTEDSPIITDATESAEEDAGESEFDTILEKVAENIENGDWDALVSQVTTRPSLATLSSVDFFPSECTGFLAVGASNNLLLHEVCKNEPTVSAVTTLLEVHNAAIKTAGQWGYLPIHCACAAGASKEVIEVLLKAHPNSIEAFGDDNMFPLHLACKQGASMEIFQLLLEAYPAACAVSDVHGKTPMDYVSSQAEGPERTQKLEILGRHVQSMVLSTAEMEAKLKESQEKSSSIQQELIEKEEKVTGLEKDLKEIQDKTLTLEGDLKENRTSDLDEQLKANNDKVVELEIELNAERAKASVFGENLKKELAKSSALENALRLERARSSCLATEMQANADEWAALGAEMEEEFKKSAAELTKERKKIAQLEKDLKAEQQTRSIYEGQLNHQLQLEQISSIDGPMQDGKEKVTFIQEKLAESKLRWLIEKQEIYKRDDANLTEAYQLLRQALKETSPDPEQQKEEWLLKRNEIIEKNDAHMAAAFKVVEDIESELDDKRANSLIERQTIYDRVEQQLTEAYKIICETEINLKQERTKWLMERQSILERNDENMAQAFMVMRDTEMSLAAKKFKLQEYEATLDKREKEIKEAHTNSKTLIRQLELAKAVSGEKLEALVDELKLQKSFSESQTKHIEALECSIEVNLSDVNAFAKEQQERLAYEKSLTDSIMDKINEKKQLMKENEEMIQVLENSNFKKDELLAAQQKKVEALEAGRREKEAQLKLNQKTMKELEASIAEKQALAKEELAEASKLEDAKATRKAAIDLEADQIKELDYNLARKQALIELEKMKEKTLQQTIAQKHELIETEVARIKELEQLIEEKENQLAKERNTIKELKVSNAEKDTLLASEKQVVEQLRKTQEEKEKVLEAQKETEAVIRSHLKEEEDLLASKQAAVNDVKEARLNIETELQHQKDLNGALERQIEKKKSLVSKEEYVAKCLQHLSMHKREFMPPGAISYLVNIYFGMEYKVYSGKNFIISSKNSIIKETHLASNFIKTQVREQYAAVQRRRDESLAMVSTAIRRRRDLVTATVRKSRDDALALIPSMPTIPTISVPRLPSVGPRSLVARLKSYGVNVDLFPKGYGVSESSADDETPTEMSTENASNDEEAPTEEAPTEEVTAAPTSDTVVRQKPTPESKLPRWTKLTNWAKKGSE